MVLEYSQRLATRRRNVMATPEHPQVATAMILAAAQGGAQAAGRAVAGLAVGQQADFVVLDADHVALAGLPAPEMLASHVFASQRTSAIRDVFVGGTARVRGGSHGQQQAARAGSVQARTQLLASAA